jgi:hypothetical protein
MTYTPDNWVILKIKNKTTGDFYKVLAGCSGGYLNGDAWRLNSGIVKYSEDEKTYTFHGSSGSKYVCHKDTEFTRNNIFNILLKLKKEFPDNIEEVKFNDIKDQIEKINEEPNTERNENS